MDVADEVAADLAAEQDALDAVVAGLSAEQWRTPTPSPGWTVADQIGHLTYFDATATLAMADPYTFMAHRRQLVKSFSDPGAFEAAFRRQAEAGADAVVCVNLSEGLSATIQAARNAATALEGELPVRVIDSTSITSGLGTQVRLASEAAAGGASVDEVVALVESLAGRTHVLGALDTLDNLKKGGRIGGAQALLGSLLSIKPLLDISTGEVAEAGKARTRRKALEWLRDQVFALPEAEQLTVAHGMAPDLDDMLALLAPRYPADSIRVTTIGPTIGTHGGPRVMGVTWVDPA